MQFYSISQLCFLLPSIKSRQYHILASLHWLPLHFRIDFKILLITFKAHLGLAPIYLAGMLSQFAALDPQVGPLWLLQTH